jgi:methyl-accepting chemotaxis protein
MGWLRRVSGRLVSAFVVPLVLFCVVGALAYRNTGTLEETNGSVAHTYEVLAALDAIASTLKDAETGQRGYLITGEDRYLAPYTSALAAIDDRIQAVADLTADNPAQQERISRLRPLIDAKFTELKQTIDLRRAEGFQAALAVVLTDQGKAVMDQIRTVMGDLADSEASLLAVRARTTEDTADTSRAAILGGVGVALLLTLLLAWVVARSILRPLSVLTERLSEIADGDGDLTSRVDETRRDEFGALGAAFNRFVAKLAATIRQIGDQATTLASASEQLSAATHQISGSASRSRWACPSARSPPTPPRPAGWSPRRSRSPTPPPRP